MRNLRRLLIILVLLFGVFVTVDRVAVRFAEDQAAAKIQSARGLASKPDVTIEGFPFLTQLIGSKLDEIKVHANDVKDQQSKVQIASLDADLTGVQVSSDYSSAVADRATGRVLLTYEALTAALPNGTTVAYGGSPGKVKVSTNIGGQTLSGSADISVTGGNQVQLSHLDTGDAGLDILGNIFSPTVPVAGLPSGLRLDSIEAQENGVFINASGTNVSLNG
ncbi:LmeA family phospholipid-binding protein [Streptacidiphilus jiangxiensis]|uniref:DUF2993 domain-containing protein n=1 Tax=Streptacidiphilus jiangxiensis TaxID=235985 RepID=A0A1H7Y105_STRJI|nr:DUF2993 domain-containing protein [Streptacidiphilus jiangxiensis]SEM39554.1 Protein of unknown function [Streptacidiphilus jiangxiensis]